MPAEYLVLTVPSDLPPSEIIITPDQVFVRVLPGETECSKGTIFAGHSQGTFPFQHDPRQRLALEHVVKR